MNEKLNLNSLNNEQYQAVTAPLGPVLVVAGAGTGKTSVLTKRIAYLIDHHHMNPDRILAITFTNKAAMEMQERVHKLIHQSLPWIGTFHRICINILRKDFSALNRNPNFKIIDEEETTVLLRDLYEKHHFSIKDLSYKNAVSLIDKCKTQGLTPDQLANGKQLDDFVFDSKQDLLTFSKIYQDFIGRCETLNLLDFNDILNLTYELLSNHHDVRDYWSHQFDYILVDEFQDTNDIQYQLVKLLVNENQNLFVVGDPDQTIYTWRGAKQSIINNFDKEYPSCKTIILNQNYRSNQSILDIANKLIVYNKNRIHKDLIAANHVTGSKPIFYSAANTDVEALWVVRQVQRLLDSGAENSDIAILYRSNYLSRPIEQMLVQYGIRYTIYGGFKFYQRSEIKDMLAYLSVIANHDEISLRRIINTPSRRISDNVVQAVLEYAHRHNLSFWDALLAHQRIEGLSNPQKNAIQSFLDLIEELETHKEERIDKIVVEVMKAVQYQDYLDRIDHKTVSNKMEYLEELLNAMETYMNRNPKWSLTKYLQDITLYISSDDKNNNKNTVSLMTVHTSKGLEFKYVFIVGFNEDIFPSRKNNSPEALEEERRLAYVALTRAKEMLYMSASGDYSVRLQRTNVPSSFLYEIGMEHLSVMKGKINVVSDHDGIWFNSKDPDSFEIMKGCLNLDQKENTYKVGDQIVHTIFGYGIVIAVRDKFITVEFDSKFGTKELIFNHKTIKRVIE